MSCELIPGSISRRKLLQVALTGLAAGAMVSFRGPGPASATESIDDPKIDSDALAQLDTLNTKIDQGEARQFRNGTVMVEGWYLPKAVVSQVVTLATS